MAYTEIHPITDTVENAIFYIVNDKTTKIQDEKNKKEKVKIYKTISCYLNCSSKKPKHAFDSLRKIYGGDTKKKQLTKNNKENLAWHCIQSFEGVIDPKIANEIGRKLALEVFENFPCVISTHTNTENTHNHIIFGAWGMDGKKYHGCIDTYRKIRKVSDRLCREYGLNVMEHTANYRLVHWKDESGKRHYYERTDRKNAIRDGEYSNANDYRNTKSYTVSEMKNETNREQIKRDIDTMLHTVNNYEELLEKLRSIGYFIKDKKKNGEWRVHVSFQAPMHEKPTRDDKIGDGEFYTREKLSEYIYFHTELKKEDNMQFKSQLSDLCATDISQEYSYSNIDVENIDEEYKKHHVKADKYVVTRRGEVESVLIKDVKRLNQKLHDTYDKAVRTEEEKKEKILRSGRSQYFLDCINANLKALHFIESKNIRSFSQIHSVVSILYDKRNIALGELDKIKLILQKANENIVIIDKVKRLENQIDRQQSDEEYREFEMAGDLEILNCYHDILRQRNLLDLQKQEKFRSMVEHYNQSYERLVSELQSVSKQIKQYDDCIDTLKRIDRENGEYEKELHRYDELKTEQNKKNYGRKYESR